MLRALAGRLDLPLVRCDDPTPEMLLVLTPERLELRQSGRGRPGPVYADFVGGRSGHRRRFGGGRRQPLARAVGLKAGISPRVLDATGGFGRDAFVLASLGCEVLLLERSPVIAALLQDGLQRALRDPTTEPIARRIRLQQADAINYLENLDAGQRPEVVYLDPMYPKRDKSALVKKEMRVLQRLVGSDPDSGALLAVALHRARYRVVVKRPVGSPWLGDIAPTTSVKSPNTRYDVYVRRGFRKSG